MYTKINNQRNNKIHKYIRSKNFLFFMSKCVEKTFLIISRKFKNKSNYNLNIFNKNYNNIAKLKKHLNKKHTNQINLVKKKNYKIFQI